MLDRVVARRQNVNRVHNPIFCQRLLTALIKKALEAAQEPLPGRSWTATDRIPI